MSAVPRNNICPACNTEQKDRKQVFCNRYCKHVYYTIFEYARPATKQERERFRSRLAQAFGFPDRRTDP